MTGSLAAQNLLTLRIGSNLARQPGILNDGLCSQSKEISVKKVIKTYDYLDESSKLLFQTVRYEPKDFRQRRPDPDNPGQWLWNLDGVEPVLYRLPELIKAPMQDWVLIPEGEKDAKRLYCGLGFTATTNPMGAGKWRSEYNEYFKGRLVALIPDNDKAGRRHAEQVANSLYGTAGEIRIVELPGVPEKGDVSDWLDNGHNKAELLQLIDQAKPFDPKVGIRWAIDISKFKPMTSDELLTILGLTIKRDNENKLITFLCQLSAYTESSQFNISFNAPSATGKSYIPIEISRLFPVSDALKIGHCSPTAFFHEAEGKWDADTHTKIVDLSHKILIFLDQPHNLLLQYLRPMLSHDEREIRLKITDKNQKYGLRTKNILLRGFPSVIFCSAGLKLDEQEATRFLLLSPETGQEKIRESVFEKLKKESDAEAYQRWLDSDANRALLKERIRAIKQQDISEVKISALQQKEIEDRFFADNKVLKPRHSRDIGRLISLVKAFALLNLWFRERDGSAIVASQEDIEEAFKVWDAISESQELGLPPYIYQLYQEVIVPAYKEKNEGRTEGLVDATGKLGLSKQDILRKHYQVYGRVLPDWQLRQQIIPMLESAGLIAQEPDLNDRRKMLIYPTI